MCSICYCASPISLFIATSLTNFYCKCYLQQLLLCYGIPLVLKWYLQYSFIYSLSLFLHDSRQIQCYKVCWSSIHFFFLEKPAKVTRLATTPCQSNAGTPEDFGAAPDPGIRITGIPDSVGWVKMSSSPNQFLSHLYSVVRGLKCLFLWGPKQLLIIWIRAWWAPEKK